MFGVFLLFFFYPVTVTHCSVIMVDTDANTVFPQTVFSGSSDLPLNDVCAMHFGPDRGLKMGMRKVGC